MMILAETAPRSLGTLPLIVMVGQIILLLGIGLYGWYKSKAGEEDYYLAGRSQGFIISSLTIMATFFSSAALLGNPGAVYRDGVSSMLFALNLPLAGAAVYVLGSRIARVGRARRYVTAGDMISDYYDYSHTLRLLAALVGVLYAVPYVLVQMRVGGHLAQQLFGDVETVTLLGMQWDLFAIGSTALSIIMVLYILVGGMRSVAMTDVIQGLLLLAGMLISGYAVLAAFGGVRPYFEAVTQLPPEALSFPGAVARWSPWAMFTLIIFAALASMIQPAQWMRYYAAKSTATLRRSAIVFALVLPMCFLFGVFLVGLGARALYPPTLVDGQLQAHPTVGHPDQSVVAVLYNFGPEVLGVAGPAIVAVILMAIIAASMSTADSNLHALSAVLTRDVYDRFVRPRASEKERAWFGRGVIVAGAIIALMLVQVGERNPEFAPLRMIFEMTMIAMAFAAQLLPVTIDMLFLRRGTRIGAIAGIVTGLVLVTFFTPVPQMLLGKESGMVHWTDQLRRLLDVGFMGCALNALVFTVVSLFTTPPDAAHRAEFARLASGQSATPPAATNKRG